MSVEGTWHPSVSTPIRRMESVAELRRRGTILTGTAYGAGEAVPLNDGRTLRGPSGAGRLPASKATGERRATSERRA